ncbi:aspartate aminotransferase family protein [Fuchsiella alkaliacetigena]|uniref:aspartate aminotransferase family protein n=1 Tax=Fuchsiella alkaliacetigena TaxID=957042 RepID=UPI00200AB1A3|nr:aspartate aminotransferase family protein [Fuchsiella alkaliacetigena]MCK8823850.1 aspartate aminotransferase family protein [Fuchsiella alkaliacetigena]
MDLTTETIEMYHDSLNPALAKLFKFMGLDSVEVEAEGMIIKDNQGREYLDCVGGYGSLNFGHRPPEIVAAVKEQLGRMPLASKLLFNRHLAEFTTELKELTPGELQYSFICNSGTEAVEGALKLARLYTGKKEIISTINSFHGKSMGALSATGREQYSKPFAPLVAGFKHIPFGDVDALTVAISEETAAVILEPIQGEGGIVIPPADYLAEVRGICNQQGVLMIVDEIQTGLGRVGSNFAVEAAGVVPDIMTLAKSLGGGVMPVGALIAKPEVWEPFIESPLLHTSTFGGNPLAAVAGKKALEILERDNLALQAKRIGTKLLAELEKLSLKYSDLITEVRGKGLLIGIELVDEGVGGMLISELIDRGLLAVYTLNQPQVIRIEPPLIMSEEEMDRVIGILETALEAVLELKS